MRAQTTIRMFVPAAAVAVAAGALLVAGGATGGTDGGPPPPVAAELTKSFAALRSARTAHDVLPQDQPGVNMLSRHFGINLSASRRVDRGYRRAWVVPGAKGMCLVTDSGAGLGGACGETSEVLAQGIVVTQSQIPGRSADEVVVEGILPDSAQAAALVGSFGRRELVQEDGAFSVTTRDRPTAVEWRDGSGRRRVPVALPN